MHGPVNVRLYVVFVIVMTSLSLEVGINISEEYFTSIFKVKVRNFVICPEGKTRSDVRLSGSKVVNALKTKTGSQSAVLV